MRFHIYLIATWFGIAGFGWAQSTAPASGAIPENPSAGAAATRQAPGGIRYAAQYGNKANNGISTAARGATNQMVVVDPNYPANEQPGPYSFSAGPFHYQDLRRGVTTDFYRNPSWTRTFDFNLGIEGAGNSAGHHNYCLYDAPPSGWTGNLLGGCEDYAQVENMPGWSIGNPSGFSKVAANGWSTFGMATMAHATRTSGITETLSIIQQKYSTGDNAAAYLYLHGEGGSTAASDESNEGLAVNTSEDNFEFSSTCATGCALGSTLIKTPLANSSQGQGRYLYDSSQSPLIGHATAFKNGLGGGTAVTTDSTVPVSSAWGTLGGTINTPVQPQAPFTTSETFNVKLSHGSFTTGTLVCFAGNFHEQAFPTSVGAASGGVQQVTFALRRPHREGTSIYQGGACGYGIEFTAYTFNGLQYLFDVVGSTDANTLQVVRFSYGSTYPLASTVKDVASTLLFNKMSSSGTTVSFSYKGGTANHPWNNVGSSIVISGSSDSALNTTCTNMQWTSTTAGTCTIEGLSGTHTTTTEPTATFGLNGYNLVPIAEVIDVQNETLSPPQVDGTLNLEPNVIAFAAGNTVRETHHYSALWTSANLRDFPTNPHGLMAVLGIEASGYGVQGGNGSATSNSFIHIQNQNPESMYINTGGYMVPPNAINFSGPYLYGINFAEGPRSDQPLINVQSDNQQSNVNYHYYPMNLVGKVGSFQMDYYPNTGDTSINARGGAATLTLYGQSGVIVNAPVTFSSTIESAVNAGTNAISGGQMNLVSGSFQSQVRAPKGIAASYVETLPATGNSGQLVDVANSTATVAGNVATFSNTTGRLQDSGRSMPIVASLTTSAAASNNVPVKGMTDSGHCSLTPTNASAAQNLSGTYVSAKTANQITVTHSAIAGMTYDVLCTGY